MTKQKATSREKLLANLAKPTPTPVCAQASVLGGRRMGEIRALIDSVSGTVETDEQVGAWSLTAHPDPPGSAPVPEETP